MSRLESRAAYAVVVTFWESFRGGRRLVREWRDEAGRCNRFEVIAVEVTP